MKILEDQLNANISCYMYQQTTDDNSVIFKLRNTLERFNIVFYVTTIISLKCVLLNKQNSIIVHDKSNVIFIIFYQKKIEYIFEL